MNSKPILVHTLPNGRKIYITFIHTDSYTVIAKIHAEEIPGQLKMARNSEFDWVPLEDSLDRPALHAGCNVTSLPIDLEAVYLKYTNDLILSEPK